MIGMDIVSILLHVRDLAEKKKKKIFALQEPIYNQSN